MALYWTQHENGAHRAYASVGTTHYSVAPVSDGHWIATVEEGGRVTTLAPTGGWRTRLEAKEACETHEAGRC